MKKYASSLLVICCLSATLVTSAQTDQPPASAGIGGILTDIFSVDNTNGIIHANELNLTPLYQFDSTRHLSGGALKADWWITQQQGMAVKYSEFSDRSTFWSVGYQARTLFKGIEVALGTGITQSVDDPLGNTRAYIEPSLTWKLPVKQVDARLHAGCSIYNAERPMLFLGVTFRFFK